MKPKYYRVVVNGIKSLFVYPDDMVDSKIEAFRELHQDEVKVTKIRSNRHLVRETYKKEYLDMPEYDIKMKIMQLAGRKRIGDEPASPAIMTM